MRDLYSPRSASSGYKSHYSGSNSSQSQHVFFQRKRTLDEFPMEHSYEDTMRMFQQRRNEREAQRLQKNQAVDEVKQLRSYSKRRFETALQCKRGTPLPPPTPQDKSLFYQEHRPSWSRSRHHSISVSQFPEKTVPKPILRPGSEPPGSVATAGRTFNHLRGNSKIYPRIYRLMQQLNQEYRVVCTAPPEVCQERRNSRDYSVASEFLLVPVHEYLSQTEDQLIAEIEQIQLEGEDWRSQDSHSDIKEPTESVKPPADEDEAEEKSEPTSRRCWVDYATVSSIQGGSVVAEVSEEQAVGLVEQDEEVILPETAGLTASAVDKTPSTLREKASAMTTKAEGKETPSKGKKGKNKKSATPEPVEIVVPPEPEVEEVVVEPELEPEPEPEPEPVPPPYICPSSVTKSQATEIKMWLKKSSFSAANRCVPIFR